MNIDRIMADSFVLKKLNLRIYRIRRDNRATVLCLSRERALRCLKEIRTEELLANQGR
jgi:hypothetical protein